MAHCRRTFTPYRPGGSAFGAVPPRGLSASEAGGAASGSIVILGSMFGGGTADRGSGVVSGRRSIPGSMFEGGMGGAPGWDGLSGVVFGVGPGPASGTWTGGRTSAADADDCMKRVATAAINRGFQFIFMPFCQADNRMIIAHQPIAWI